MNIIETIQKNLGFDTLKKIDPNTQETKAEDTLAGKQCRCPSRNSCYFNRHIQ